MEYHGLAQRHTVRELPPPPLPLLFSLFLSSLCRYSQAIFKSRFWCSTTPFIFIPTAVCDCRQKTGETWLSWRQPTRYFSISCVCVYMSVYCMYSMYVCMYSVYVECLLVHYYSTSHYWVIVFPFICDKIIAEASRSTSEVHSVKKEEWESKLMPLWHSVCSALDWALSVYL